MIGTIKGVKPERFEEFGEYVYHVWWNCFVSHSLPPGYITTNQASMVNRYEIAMRSIEAHFQGGR